mmetsp:Transcript_18015/g.38491  ORF Transcript_18015/g.38491 Transcript_18015/m.38491 type:complete len:165 (-) Transcript_18015:164-658(-)
MVISSSSLLCFPVGALLDRDTRKSTTVSRTIGAPMVPAARTPLEAANLYIKLSNKHDFNALKEVVASPCDVYGGSFHGQALDRYLRKKPDMEIKVTKPPRVLERDPSTVEFECIRSWHEGSRLVEYECSEYLTFSSGCPRVARMSMKRNPVPVTTGSEETGSMC